MSDATLPLPIEPIPSHGPQPSSAAFDPTPVDPYLLPAIAAAPAALPVAPAPAPPAPIVARIGEISVSSTTVYTPTGEMPLRGSQWILTDQWQAHSKIPAWAIVLTVLTFFCIPIFNFLFLLAKETYYTGVVAVSVASAGRHYVARIPVSSQVQVANLQSQVNYTRSLAAL